MKRFWQRLSKRDRALVIASCFVFLLVLARYFLLSPLLERREWVRNQLEIQPQLLEKNLRYLSRKEEIATNLEEARAELKEWEATLLTGDTPSVSASDLQETVQTLAAKEGTQVISTRVLNPETTGSFTKIPVQVEISGQIDQVSNLIKGIDSAEKLLVISELNIRSLFTPAAAARQPGVASRVPVQNLRVSLTISGFARSKSPPPTKSDPAPAKARSDGVKTPGQGTPRR